MACEPICGPGNIPIGFICGERPRRAAGRCVGCRKTGHRLCDGRGCNAPLCGDCSPSLRAIDRDFCPTCASKVEHGACIIGGIGGASVPCRGVLVVEHELCVQHALLFDEWAGRHGGLAVYRDGSLTREQKRQKFRAWVVATPTDVLNLILEQRHMPGAA